MITSSFCQPGAPPRFSLHLFNIWMINNGNEQQTFSQFISSVFVEPPLQQFLENLNLKVFPVQITVSFENKFKG